MLLSMEKRDARTLGQQAQEEVRRQAVKLLKSGHTRVAVAAQLDVSRQHVGEWWRRYQEGGWAALKKRKRGVPEGTSRKLTPEQEAEVRQLITDKMPDQLKLSFALWTRQAVRQLIKERYGVDFALQSMSVVLRRWGLTPQRPVKRAYEQRPTEVKQWLDETYPGIAQRAQTEGAEIYWGDETSVKPEAHTRRSYAPKGQTPVVRQAAKRFHASVISAINNQGKMQWMALKEALNADIFIDFLGRLIRHRKRKIFLIVDNLRVHHSKLVKEWLEKNKHRIELFYLPSYSPELNPDEYLNRTLKHEAFKGGPVHDEMTLKAKVNVAMFMLSIQPKKIASCFQHPLAKYAA